MATEELTGDELGAGVPDAMVRQIILARVPSEESISIYLLSGGFPMSRIKRMLAELAESGEIVFGQKDLGGVQVPSVCRVPHW